MTAFGQIGHSAFASNGNQPLLSNRDKPKANQHKSAKSHDASMQTLADMGISKTQSKRWQKLSQISDDEFESALSEKQQTTSALIKKASGNKGKMDGKALWLWGRIRDFEREDIAGFDIEYIYNEMTEAMHSDLARVLPSMPWNSSYLTILRCGFLG